MKIIYSKKDFEIFKNESQRLIDLFGIKGWKVVYCWQQLVRERFAEIYTNSKDMVASISFTKEVEVADDCVDNVKEHAKHEVCHLLLGKMSDLGKTRFLNPDEIYSAEEEIVNILVKIVK